MRKIHYVGGDFVTSQEIAEAVLDYAALLGNRGQAANVNVPAVGLVDGETTVELLIGPASQLASEPVETEEDAPDDREFLADIRRRITQTTTRAWSGEDWDLES